MASELDFAHLTYGTRIYPVRPNEVTPIPATIDPNAPDFLDTVRSIFAMMSNASGGHIIRTCKLSVWNGSVNLSGDGVHVFYKDPNAKKFAISTDDPEGVAAFVELVEKNRIVMELGSVVTDQYGDGWKRARWAKIA